jgi:hypothetical protein
MDTLGSAILAFLIASFISGLELVTIVCPRTFFLMTRNRALYTYALVYGAVAFVVTLAFQMLALDGTIRVTGPGLSSPWVRAIVVGVTVKAFLHINLFNVTIGSQSMPVGLETFVQLYEPALVRTIVFDEFSEVRTYIQPYAARHPDLADVKTKIKANIPPALSKEECGAFENDIDKAGTVIEALHLYLRFVGRKTFERVFP